jgi:hypothetical protein
VEWSPYRRAWCIQDAAGHCLTHVESIVGQDRDVETAIPLAKRMIVDGRMPTPEQAQERLCERQRLDDLRIEDIAAQLGEAEHGLLEPFTMEGAGEPIGLPWDLVIKTATKSLK